MTILNSSDEIKKGGDDLINHHEDFRIFGLIIFLIADGMTFAGFFCSLPYI